MGLLNIIKQRPNNQKSIFSIITALVLTFFIVALWFSFSNNFSDNEAGKNNDKLSSISPWQMIKEEFSKTFSFFGAGISNSASSSPVIVEVIPDNQTISTSTATSTKVSTTSKNKI